MYHLEASDLIQFDWIGALLFAKVNRINITEDKARRNRQAEKMCIWYLNWQICRIVCREVLTVCHPTANLATSPLQSAPAALTWQFASILISPAIRIIIGIYLSDWMLQNTSWVLRRSRPVYSEVLLSQQHVLLFDVCAGGASSIWARHLLRSNDMHRMKRWRRGDAKQHNNIAKSGRRQDEERSNAWVHSHNSVPEVVDSEEGRRRKAKRPN